MSTRKQNNRAAFSLVELVIVIVIIGIIAAIAVPRISRGSEGAGAAALAADLHVLRNALDMYAAEHAGSYPTVTNFVPQMTAYTDASNGMATAKDTTHIYGPYIAAVPVLKVGDGKGKDTVAASAAAGVGWVYNELSGQINANGGLTAADAAGKLYKDY